jgi:hypothetical protein
MIQQEIDHVSDTVMQLAYASFRDPEQPERTFIGTGKVFLNQRALVHVPQSTAGSSFISDTEGVELAPPGEFNRWEIEGGSDIPYFKDSIATPLDEFRILRPLNRDSASLQDGITIQWNLTDNSSDMDTVLLLFLVQPDENQPRQVYAQVSVRAGTYTFNGANLKEKGFHPGTVLLTTDQHKTESRLIEGRIRATLEFILIETLSITLVE